MPLPEAFSWSVPRDGVAGRSKLAALDLKLPSPNAISSPQREWKLAWVSQQGDLDVGFPERYLSSRS